jgi:PAS domain S-box-containing protein
MKPSHRPFVCLVVGLLTLPLCTRALDPHKSVFQFNTQNWTRATGLPADKITSVTQTTDGYIWLGSQSGLVRYDGVEFKVVPIDLPEAHGHDVAKLQSTRDGRLWFSIVDGGYGVYDGHRFSAIGDESWKSAVVSANTIFVASDGAVWGGSVHGWSRWVMGKPELAQREEGQDRSVLSFSEDRTGRIWMGTAEAGLFYWQGGKFVLLPDADLKKQNIYSVVLDPAGDLWVGTGRGLFHYDSKLERKEIVLEDGQTNSLLIDRNGVLWIATNHRGIGRLEGGQFKFLRKIDGLSSDNIKALYEDLEGSLWAATVDGLSQITDLKFPIFSSTEGLSTGSGLSITTSRRGGVWIGMADGATYFDGHTALTVTDPAILPNQYVRRVYETKSGDVFLCDGNKNINVVRDGRLVARYASTQWPEAFAEDDIGLIAGIGPNLYRMKDGVMVPYPLEGEPPSFNWINNLLLARDGALWLATNDGAWRIKDGRYRHYTTSDGFSSNRVLFVFQDTDESLWMGLATGMVRIKGDRITSITGDDGLPDNRIFAIVPDDYGFFWIASGRGIVRIARQNLTDFAEGKITRVQSTLFEGLESIKFNDRTDQNPSAVKTPDGRIWFPNPRGVAMVDPVHYVTNRQPPSVYIQKVGVNGVNVATGNKVSLKSGDRSIEFQFTALSYIAPKKVLVRYQLEGFDPTWIDAGARRSALYNNLNAGSYTFRVQAANADGVWNTTGAELSLVLPPLFHQTLWFYALCAVAVTLGLMGGYRWKMRRVQMIQEKLQEQNDELERAVRLRTDELASSLSLLQATLDSTADGILAVQFSGEVVSYNRQFTELWGIPAETMRPARDVDVQRFTATQVKDPEAFKSRINEIHASGIVEAFDTIEMKDGRVIERYCKPQQLDGKNVGIVINFRDITERKRFETTIAEASALLESMLENTLDIVFFKDAESRFVRYSRALVLLHGATDRDALKGKSDFDLYPESEARIFQEEEQRILRTGQPLVDKLEKATQPDGRVSWVMTTKVPWRDIHGNIIGTFGVARDVTALKQTETRLAYERDLLTALLDNSPDKVYFKDVKSRFITCSKAQAETHRVASVDEVIGKTDFDYFSAEHAQAAFDDEQEIIRTGRPLIGKVEKETWRDGRVTWALTSKMVLRDSAGATIGTIGISKDITELKAAEAKLEEVHRQLLQTSRQAGMAEVATSVLHNVGNVLNSVNVSATLVSEQMRNSKVSYVSKVATLLTANAADLSTFLNHDPRGQKIGVYLSTLGADLAAEQQTMIGELGHLRKNIEHIKEVVSMQQSFAKISGVSESIAFTELVEDALRINESSLMRHEVELVRDFRAKPQVVIERHKVMQILVNLVRNAKYACDESGRPDKKIIVRLTQAGSRVAIAVIDNGVGIPAENLTRIFAHGFTTKKEGHGFGLHSGALAAKELGGTLNAFSDGPGQGATFVLELPLDPGLADSAITGTS